MTRNYRLKGHGGFMMREGWYTKGISAVYNHPDIFTKENFYGADILGVGTAMAKAIRYWLQVSGLIEERRGEGVYLTPIGECIYENDLYFEDIFTIWLMHKNIVLKKKQATTWSVFFQEYPMGDFSKEQLVERLYQMVLTYSGETELSERSFRDDCSTLLQMYTKNQSENQDPEDKNQSVFARLELVRKNYRGYVKNYGESKRLPKEIVLCMLADMLDEKGVGIDELLSQENGPGRVLNLNRITLNEFLDEWEQEGVIRVHRTAGLDMVYPVSHMPKEYDIVQKYYKSR